ncbi:hypothetical protein BDZ85DRAFT_286410 [Elsinoe ampelina]|uniref:Uncharacterized protein n=1 Tax=Elsinoe ampelina TaxID=302913 RepID=A0A6A6FY09_9PEZI|nr:hypothetical protein BDZ85DRAFT_286410 [Elsinoe ampelina]
MAPKSANANDKSSDDDGVSSRVPVTARRKATKKKSAARRAAAPDDLDDSDDDLVRSAPAPLSPRARTTLNYAEASSEDDEADRIWVKGQEDIDNYTTLIADEAAAKALQPLAASIPPEVLLRYLAAAKDEATTQTMTQQARDNLPISRRIDEVQKLLQSSPAPKTPKRFPLKRDELPFFRVECELFHYAYEGGGVYFLLGMWHHFDQTVKGRGGGGTAPTTKYTRTNFIRECGGLLAMFDEDLIKCALRGTISDYYSDPAKHTCLPTTPSLAGQQDPEMIERIENYIFILTNESGNRMTIGQMQLIVDMIEKYSRDLLGK